MKKLLIMYLTILPFLSFSQDQFISFLKSKNLPDCFAGLNEDQVDRLVTERELRADWTSFTIDYKSDKEVLYLYTTSRCDDIEKIHLKYHVEKGVEYIFMFKEKSVSNDSYGRLKLYVKEGEEWTRGRRVELTWQQLFNLSDKDIKRLRDADQFPKYMIRFEEKHIMFDIPWKLYTFGEGSDNDGFSMSKAKQPVKFPYRYFIL